jgi:hypothetical protein
MKIEIFLNLKDFFIKKYNHDSNLFHFRVKLIVILIFETNKNNRLEIIFKKACLKLLKNFELIDFKNLLLAQFLLILIFFN